MTTALQTVSDLWTPRDSYTFQVMGMLESGVSAPVQKAALSLASELKWSLSKDMGPLETTPLLTRQSSGVDLTPPPARLWRGSPVSSRTSTRENGTLAARVQGLELLGVQ